MRYEIEIPAIKIQVNVRAITDEPRAEETSQQLVICNAALPLADACKAVSAGGVIQIEEPHASQPSVLSRPGVRIIGGLHKVGPVDDNVGDGARNFLTIDAPDVRLEQMKLDGKFVHLRGIRGTEKSLRLMIDRCEVSRFAWHGIDVDGDETTIENCVTHHNLWHDGVNRQDAHGIVTKQSKGLKIIGTSSYQNSGDSFQADMGAGWQDILIDRCTFYDAPLESDMGGFRAGELVSENGIDTKRGAQMDEGRIVIVASIFHGFRTKYIPIPAALNLKHHVFVTVNRCRIRDNALGLRLRSHDSTGFMRCVIANCSLSDNDLDVRVEDQAPYRPEKTCDTRLVHCDVRGIDFDAIAGSPLDPKKGGNGWKPTSGAWNCKTPANSVGLLASDGNTTDGLVTVPVWARPYCATDIDGNPRNMDSAKAGAWS